MEAGGGAVLMVRDDAGTLRAFANFCRHRGALLLEGCGTARKILCPYHAWSYRLNGAVLASPSMDDTEGFDKAEYGLLPIRLETWAGFVFINYSNDSPSVKKDIVDLAYLLAWTNMDDMFVSLRNDIKAT